MVLIFFVQKPITYVHISLLGTILNAPLHLNNNEMTKYRRWSSWGPTVKRETLLQCNFYMPTKIHVIMLIKWYFIFKYNYSTSCINFKHMKDVDNKLVWGYLNGVLGRARTPQYSALALLPVNSTWQIQIRKGIYMTYKYNDSLILWDLKCNCWKYTAVPISATGSFFMLRFLKSFRFYR